MSHRIEQIESLLKRELSTILAHKLSDPRIEGMVSITRLSVSPDLHDAYVYVSVMPDKFEKKTLYGLRHATGHIHSLLRKAVAMRSVPQLEFRLDQALKKQAKVFEAIQRGVDKERADPPRSTPDPEEIPYDPDNPQPPTPHQDA
ncbi:MAG: 30S ribosome-binding factor RbfA [Phycisphaera sp.]|nr:30S ribosome-binding factor RbfA [Phycisphaera sp.]